LESQHTFTEFLQNVGHVNKKGRDRELKHQKSSKTVELTILN